MAQRPLYHRRTVLAAMVAAGLGLPAALTACGKVKAVDPVSVSHTPVPSRAPADAGSDLSDFGTRLFLADTGIRTGDNAAISPYSIYLALAMTRLGARGTTAAQLDRLLGGGPLVQQGNTDAIAAVFTAAQKRAITADHHGEPVRGNPDPKLVMVPADRLWIEQGMQVVQGFETRLAEAYNAGIEPADFAGAPDAVRGDINDWVSEHTNKLIPQLLSPGTVTADTRLALVNALFFKGAWAGPMRERGNASFTTGTGRTVSTPMMTTPGTVATGHGQGWTSVTIPYQGLGVAMTIVMPDKGAFGKVRGALGSVLPSATRQGVGLDRAGQQAGVTMPEFRTDTGTELTPALRRLGVTAAFDAPDLSGIAGRPGELRIGAVQHAAKVDTDKNGTVAAAATAVLGTTSAQADPHVVTIDRAFLYSIHDTTSGAPLFLGQVSDPTAG